ncbi:hypothetical protein QAD02_015923 [Eretmocerus hayati]|uniref:Uncharacterized protein n=1 Tax=Eretmocerus hayati TaxID=131215 RepID=A0ACC2P9L6_9HYME|nr:hypothetical protein QAD02_015923 [Eretmocerus hayati]
MSGALVVYDGPKQEGSTSSNCLEPPDTGATKKLARGISRATENADLVDHAKLQLQLGSFDMPEFTFSLPDLSIYPDDFRQFLEKDLIEGGCLSCLESAGRLNWWCGGKNRVLWPLATTGDGNCLLHAASLGMWGFHDRELFLRETLYNTLSKGEIRDALYRRWKWRQASLNAVAGLSYTDEEWITEWQGIVDMASTHPRNQMSTSYQSLEEIHILALAHVLRRPIIVVAETMLRDSEGEALAPIAFGGIYLPLEIDGCLCHRTPLLLAYHSAHFSPLVTVDSSSDPSEGSLEGYSIPLVDPDTGQLYPVLFAVDPGPDWDWNASQELLDCQSDTMEILIREYMDCEYQVFTPDEIDRLSESDVAKNKTAKQLMGVAKQFGSIGKSVSKRIWSMAKRPKNLPSSSTGGYSDTLLCVRIRSRRHQYADKMLQNYLESAHARYLLDRKTNSPVSEMNYGAGKSKFYAASDSNCYETVSKLPATTNPNKDQTLYLSRSTFYDHSILPKESTVALWNKPDADSVKPCRTMDCKFFGSAEHQYYCSQCWSDRHYHY